MSENAEGLIAIWDGLSPGTRNMIELAHERGLRMFVLRVDTGAVEECAPKGVLADVWLEAEERAAMKELAAEVPRREAEREAGRLARAYPSTRSPKPTDVR
jgi:hypothetical protein